MLAALKKIIPFFILQHALNRQLGDFEMLFVFGQQIDERTAFQHNTGIQKMFNVIGQAQFITQKFFIFFKIGILQRTPICGKARMLDGFLQTGQVFGIKQQAAFGFGQ